MDNDFSDMAATKAPPPLPPANQKPKRYDFEFPEGIHISDLLAVQLAECVRLVRNLTDNASQPHLMDIERLRMVDQMKDIVGASTQLTREIGRLQSGTRYEDDDVGTLPKRRKT